jgi:hypothetical protein
MWVPNVYIYKSYDEAFSKYTEIYNKLLYEVKYLCTTKGHYLNENENENLNENEHDKKSCDNKQIYNYSYLVNNEINFINKEINCFIQRGGDEGMKRPEGVKFVSTLIS